MAVEARIRAVIRGLTTLIDLAANRGGELGTFQRLPSYLQLVNEGRVWRVQDTTTTVVPTTFPTTTSGLTVQNPTADKYYVVFIATAVIDVAPASLGSVSLMQAVHAAPVTAYTRDVALTAVSSQKAGQGAYPGAVILDRAATVVNDNWTPLGGQVSNVVNSQGWMQMTVPMVVPVIIPPLMHWSLAAVGNSATFEAGLGLTWAELTYDELF